ncbi:Murein DD-endopeptidase MepM and murein hydrolase activator NlpD, contain LysM domain [Nocardioides scoriae]|uniref:Murein DD-endopeptidase MepM and murein hydrolase activator NlpD, contain LysM domain n=1 Tax=Nocardioides scoriae TaxID=642780 RepID=A0A1H1LAV7_9ACTN|nr:M23 family metallopeptidase [Nocardioides scoriae]SDR71452.1 Murein DD-endopeptidase MepM and murein hydrolase activator NlpD, contain LysM domain [Nocardioides scoriae]
MTVSALLALSSVVVTVPIATADDDLRDKQRDARSDVRSAQEDLQESSRALAAAATRLREARAKLSGAQQRLGAAQAELVEARRLDLRMQARLEAAEARLARAQAALEVARERVRGQRADIGRLAASMYVNGDPSMMGLSVVLNSQDPAEATSQLNTVDSLMSRQDLTLDELRATRAAMVAEEAEVAAAKEAVAEQRAAAATNLSRSQELERQAAAARTEVASLVVGRRAAEAQAGRARAADAGQLRAAEQQAARIKRLILERAARQRGGVTGASGGFLARPVPGYVTSPYGYRIHPIYGYYGLHDGTDFHAPCGTPNVAVAAGTVISTAWSDVYGNRLYLDVGQVNGKNMTVVYNHLSSYAVGAGQRVGRGQVVGYAGTTGWSTACHLHFSVLLDGNPVDPMRYL